MDEFKDIKGNLLKEGLYLRTDRIFLTHSVQNIVYIELRAGLLYQESLETPVRPLQVSDTTFQPLSERDLNWLRERLGKLEKAAQPTIPVFEEEPTRACCGRRL